MWSETCRSLWGNLCSTPDCTWRWALFLITETTFPPCLPLQRIIPLCITCEHWQYYNLGPNPNRPLHHQYLCSSSKAAFQTLHVMFVDMEHSCVRTREHGRSYLRMRWDYWWWWMPNPEPLSWSCPLMWSNVDLYCDSQWLSCHRSNLPHSGRQGLPRSKGTNVNFSLWNSLQKLHRFHSISALRIS